MLSKWPVATSGLRIVIIVERSREITQSSAQIRARSHPGGRDGHGWPRGKESAMTKYRLDAANTKHYLQVGVYTDANLATLAPVKQVLDSLTRSKVNYVLYDKVRVEPTNESFIDAANFAKKEGLDAFLAVGGGSVMDTAKAANLYSSDPGAEFLDYVNAPIGRGLPVTCSLKPLVAVPTTSGTGSETTGVAVFDYQPLHAKTGIASRALRSRITLVCDIYNFVMLQQF